MFLSSRDEYRATTYTIPADRMIENRVPRGRNRPRDVSVIKFLSRNEILDDSRKEIDEVTPLSPLRLTHPHVTSYLAGHNFLWLRVSGNELELDRFVGLLSSSKVSEKFISPPHGSFYDQLPGGEMTGTAGTDSGPDIGLN